MPDLQLTLFPAVVVPAPELAGERAPAASPLGSGGPAGDIETSARPPAPAMKLDLLPRRIPAGGLEVSASLLGTPVRCFVRRSDRARRLRLLVDRDAVLTVVLPRRFPLPEVRSALEEHARWIARTVLRTRARSREARPPLAQGREIYLFGRPHVLRLLEADETSGRARIWSQGEEILVRLPVLHPRSPAEVVRGWLRTAATREIPPRALALNRPLGFPLKRVTVRDQRTKWGACSAAGNVSINWRLALAPPEVLDYVIVHELCHLRELNHSRRFWRLLRSLRPDYEQERAWLKENGDDLDV